MVQITPHLCWQLFCGYFLGGGGSLNIFFVCLFAIYISSLKTCLLKFWPFLIRLLTISCCVYWALTYNVYPCFCMHYTQAYYTHVTPLVCNHYTHVEYASIFFSQKFGKESTHYIQQNRGIFYSWVLGVLYVFWIPVFYQISDFQIPSPRLSWIYHFLKRIHWRV